MIVVFCYFLSCFFNVIFFFIMLVILFSLGKISLLLYDFGVICWDVFSKGFFVFGFIDVELKCEDVNLILLYCFGLYMLGELLDLVICFNIWKMKNCIGSDMDKWLVVLK